MKTRAIVWNAPLDVTYDTVDVPKLGPRDVLIETAYTLVSPGTEKEWLSSNDAHVVLGTTFPFVPGYSVAGTVEAVGEEVTEWSVGDRVVGGPPYGAHAAHVVVPSALTFGVADNVALADAAFFNLGMTAAHTLAVSGLRLGDSVAIVGQGPIGLLATQIARSYGAWPVTALELDPARRKSALNVGATRAIDPTHSTDFAGWIGDSHGGAEVTVDLSASVRGLGTAISATRSLGTVVLSTGMNTSLEIPYGDVFIKGLTLKGAFVNARHEQVPDDTRTFLALLARGELTVPESMIVRPNDAAALYQRLLDGDRQMPTPIFDWT